MNETRRARKPIPGIAVAGATAAVSGFSVFLNSYGVHARLLGCRLHDGEEPRRGDRPARRDPGRPIREALNLSLAGARRHAPRTASSPRLSAADYFGLAYVGTIGGGIAFILFFTGLQRTSPVPAAFLHDTLVVFVALVAWPLLGERLRLWNVIAIAFLVVGAVASSGGIGPFHANTGSALVLGATILWAAETGLAKRLLRRISPATLGLVRMGVGALVLVCYVVAVGDFSALVGLNATALRWVLVTGLLLGAYVGTWMTALSRASAIDVTSVLVASTVVTLVLEAIVQHKGLGPEVLGISLMVVGTALAVSFWGRVARA